MLECDIYGWFRFDSDADGVRRWPSEHHPSGRFPEWARGALPEGWQKNGPPPGVRFSGSSDSVSHVMSMSVVFVSNKNTISRNH